MKKGALDVRIYCCRAEVARVDAVEKVTGAAQYGADVHPPWHALRQNCP